MTNESLRTQYVHLKEEGPIATVSIDRPDRLNALNPEVLGELHLVFHALSSKPQVRCIVLRGEGKAFVAGADITAMESMGPAEAETFASLGHRTFDAIEAMEVPVIAAVNGFALGGGCELALACDFIYASTQARFGQPEVKLGIIPGFGGSQRLPRRVGIAQARELIYSGRVIDAQEALRIGLVNQVVAPEALEESVKRVAREIAAMAPNAVVLAKRAIAEGEGLPLREANQRELKAFGECFTKADREEGIAAFLAKRAPTFADR